MKMKLNKTKIIVALSLLSMSSMAQAQWAVVNVNDTYFFGPGGIFTQSVASMVNSLKAAMDENTAVLDVTRRQMAQDSKDRDSRNRAAMGQANIAQQVMKMVPTLEACAAASKRSGTNAGVTASGAGALTKKNPFIEAKSLHSEADKLALLVKDKKELGTCSQDDVLSGNGMCSTIGNYGGSNRIAPSDLTYLAIKGNTNNADKFNKEQQEYANFTIDQNGYDVAMQYIANSVLYAAPTALTEEQAKRPENKTYLPMYNAAMVKLYSVQQAYSDILASRMPLPLNDDSIAKANWEKNKPVYQNVMNMKAPENPSFIEYMNFTAMLDFIGTSTQNVPTNEIGYLREINEKLKLNNMVAVRQLAQQENTNILLGQLLAQSVTPVNINELKTQYSAIDRETRTTPIRPTPGQ